VTRTADPLAGSFFIEHLTDEIEASAREVLREIEDIGGAVSALEQGIPQLWITEEAYRTEQRLASGECPKVGVNVHITDGGSREVELFQPAPGIEERQVERTRRRCARRDGSACSQALRQLERDTADGRNVMPALVAAARAGATVGEMSDVFRQAFGEFREPAPW
jgi:methylmalonyl-CoA mutase N-terminal domain/subunit